MYKFILLVIFISGYCFSRQNMIDSYDLFNRIKVANAEKSNFINYSSEGNIDLATGKFGISIPFFTIQNEYKYSNSLIIQYFSVKTTKTASDVGIGSDLVGEGSVTPHKKW